MKLGDDASRDGAKKGVMTHEKTKGVAENFD
jgi:hypothetical protein